MCVVKRYEGMDKVVEDEGIVYLTKHAIDRMKERNGWNEKTAFRMIAKVYDDGIDLASANMGYLSMWARRKKSKHPEHDFILYGEYVYVFIGNVILTSENPPKRETVLRSFRHLKNKLSKKEHKSDIDD